MTIRYITLFIGIFVLIIGTIACSYSSGSVPPITPASTPTSSTTGERPTSSTRQAQLPTGTPIPTMTAEPVIPTATPISAATPIPTATPPELHFVALGDVMLGRTIGERLQAEGPSLPHRHSRHYMASSNSRLIYETYEIISFINYRFRCIVNSTSYIRLLTSLSVQN
jgi:hypothetical protein